MDIGAIAQDRCDTNQLYLSNGYSIGRFNNNRYSTIIVSDQNIANGTFGLITAFVQMPDSCHNWILVDTENHCLHMLDVNTTSISLHAGKCKEMGYKKGVGHTARFTLPRLIILHKYKKDKALLSQLSRVTSLTISTGAVGDNVYIVSRNNPVVDMAWDKDHLLVISTGSFARFLLDTNGSLVSPSFSAQPKNSFLSVIEYSQTIRLFLVVNRISGNISVLQGNDLVDIICRQENCILDKPVDMLYCQRKSSLFIAQNNDIFRYSGKYMQFTH